MSDRSRWTAWLPIIQAGLILAVSSIPSSGRPLRLFPHADKLVHALEFAVLGALAVHALVRCRQWSLVRWPIAAACCIAWGAIDETYQRLIPGRTPSLGDFAADAVGAIAGCLAMTWWLTAERRR